MTDPGPPREPDRPDDVDRRFREIVAGLGTDLPEGPGIPERPGADRVNPPPSGVPHTGGPRAGVTPEDPGPPEGMATDFRSYSPPEEDDHFVPPPTPPLPAGDLHFWAILTGLVGGPLLVVLSAVLPVLDPGWAALGAALTIAGFVLLVLRQPRRRSHGDGWGAQV